MTETQAETHNDIVYPATLPFILVHLACFAAIWTGVTWSAVGIGVALYWLRMFGVTGGYHRYFSHRAFATSRTFQFLLACLAQSSAQKSVLWWAAKHRHHHLHSDTELDLHSPRHSGFFHSHIGWIFARGAGRFEMVKVDDLARYPELVWLHRLELLPAVVLGFACFLIAGWSGLVVGFFWSTVALYHGTFCINSLAHVRGRVRYVTGDDSRNNWLLAIVTMGEGWHNNHHACQSSARQGFRWWEFDPTYYILRGLSLIGIVRDLKTPPESVLRNEGRLGSRVVQRAAERLAAHYNTERIAQAISAALHASELTSLSERLARARARGAEAMATVHLPHMPSRQEILAQAGAMFARTPSIEQIVDRAYEMLHERVGASLAEAVAVARTSPASSS